MSNEAGGSLRPWRTIARKTLQECRIFNVDIVRRESPDGEKSGDFFLLDSADWVNIVAVTDHEELVFIRQYRHGTDELALEVPGGILDEGESPQEAAKRELLEETGYDAEHLELIGQLRPNPAFLNNWNYTILATGIRHIGQVDFDEHEEIETLLVPLDQLDDLLRSGAMTHALAFNALMWYKLYRERRPGGKSG